MEPALAGDVVTFAVEMFVDHVRVVVMETVEFLLDARPGLEQKLPVALVPEFVAVGQRGRNARTCGLDDMLVQGVGIEGREVPMPEDAGMGSDHVTGEARRWQTPSSAFTGKPEPGC